MCSATMVSYRIQALDGHPEPLRSMFTNAVLDFLPVCPRPVQICNHRLLELVEQFYKMSACHQPGEDDRVPDELTWLTLEGTVYDLQREFYYKILGYVSINSTKFLGIVGIQADICTPLEDLYVMLVACKIWHAFPAHAFRDCDKQQVVIPSTNFNQWSRALQFRSLSSSKALMILLNQLTAVEGCIGSIDGPLEDWPSVHQLVLRRLDAVALDRLLSDEEKALLHTKLHRDILQWWSVNHCQSANTCTRHIRSNSWGPISKALHFQPHFDSDFEEGIGSGPGPSFAAA